MLSFILQAAQQVVPDVHIVMQQSSAQGGMSEWDKTILSAAVGAVFGIAGNIAMEFVKVRIQKRAVARQLINELKWNFSYAVAAKDFLAQNRNADAARKDQILRGSREFIRDIYPKRFTYYMGNQQSITWEIEKIDSLTDFYTLLQEAGKHDIDPDPYEDLRADIALAVDMCQPFLSAHSPDLKPDLSNALIQLSLKIDGKLPD